MSHRLLRLYAERRSERGTDRMGLNRSEQMARIRGSDTSPEVALRRALWARGLRYRVKARTPGGRPDVTFSKQQVAVFIDGCFWHGCPLHYARPRSRQDFWSAKLAENIDRDCRQSTALQAAGWCVVRLWEHEVILDLLGATEQVELALRRNVASWTMQRRVRRVLDLGGGLERRELVALGSPEAVIEFVDGARITAKARVLKGVAG
jgi:DNA mismatch endonuclease, patch repair protein